MWHAQPWSVPFDVRLMNLISRLLMALILLGLCVWGGLWYIGRPEFALKVIYVQGQEELKHINAATLRVAVASRVRGNFFTVDLDEVKAVFESAPWVRFANVRRRWPHGLDVMVQEYQPVALWGKDRQTSHLLDIHGDIFEANAADAEDQNLPLFDAPEDYPDAGQKMWDVYLALASEVIVLDQHIEVLGLSEQGVWSMQLSNGVYVVIGRGELLELVVRVRDFSQTAKVALAPYGENALIRADLRYSGGYAVQLEGVHTQVPPIGGTNGRH